MPGSAAFLPRCSRTAMCLTLMVQADFIFEVAQANAHLIRLWNIDTLMPSCIVYCFVFRWLAKITAKVARKAEGDRNAETAEDFEKNAQMVQPHSRRPPPPPPNTASAPACSPRTPRPPLNTHVWLAILSPLICDALQPVLSSSLGTAVRASAVDSRLRRQSGLSFCVLFLFRGQRRRASLNPLARMKAS